MANKDVYIIGATDADTAVGAVVHKSKVRLYYSAL